MATKVYAADRTINYRANEVHLKQKIKELEEEVSSLKRRLDKLRKAKHTTVVKREREILEVGAPFGKRETKGLGNKELDKKLLEKDNEWRKEMDAMRKKFAAERNEKLENDNLVLMEQNKELRLTVDSLLSDLNVKEARWSEMEEKLKLKLKRSWGEKYKEWVNETGQNE